MKTTDGHDQDCNYYYYYDMIDSVHSYSSCSCQRTYHLSLSRTSDSELPFLWFLVVTSILFYHFIRFNMYTDSRETFAEVSLISL